MEDFEITDLDLDPNERVFGQSSTHWGYTAMTLGTRSTHVPYTVGFKEAGDALIKQGLQDHVQDLVLFPALYCYRHALELTLKELIDQGRRWEYERPEVIRTHKLSVLWPQARKVIDRAWPEGDATQMDALEALVLELDSVDVDGEQFRYDRTRVGEGRALPQELHRVDLGHVYKMMQKLFGLLFGAIDGIGEMLAAAPDESGY